MPSSPDMRICHHSSHSVRGMTYALPQMSHFRAPSVARVPAARAAESMLSMGVGEVGMVLRTCGGR
jgi:hypothetical protein